ncbi:WSC-domain-containing protein [Eremomyces bilateralis CBS 781.70]|uniref:WSC-domain-containing protein n=1 Tax=Eremomyces bilateralis CBS 781.70 TaxID=1392243 RepID=A0A6G1FT93_9PEZI|nr:WSC-domain-containing protein [Eremomyces bilateralis CBS 781.70]KAF1808881.1 WSC-domain-containing protein [Eremomyces bilateralis CBS 781.70]
MASTGNLILRLGLIAGLFTSTYATFVVQCYSRLVDDMLDHVVNPGSTSGHLHAICGGNGFAGSMTFDQARASSCSNCNIKEDLSNYWTPKLFFRAQNSRMAIYYLHRPGPDNDPLIPFPPGFRMLAGDMNKRTPGNDFASLAVRHRCIGTNQEITNLPLTKCNGGVRTQVVFPSCWDGINSDSTDHKSHVVYPVDGYFDGGRCPKSHPKHLITLFYEVYYSSDLFSDLWTEDGKTQPFVFSNGDTTGHGFHGDFLNGWSPETLEKAVNNCVDGTPNCPEQTFTFYEQGDTQKCKLQQVVQVNAAGVLQQPANGCKPGSGGPIAAPTPAKPGTSVPPSLPPANVPTPAPSQLPSTLVPVPSGPTTSHSVQDVPSSKPNISLPSGGLPGPASPPGDSGKYTDMSSAGWRYLGCFPDSSNSRILSATMRGSAGMTVEKCLAICTADGFGVAGVKWSSEYWCGPKVPVKRTCRAVCDSQCKGSRNQICGGTGALGVYQKVVKETRKVEWVA